MDASAFGHLRIVGIRQSQLAVQSINIGMPTKQEYPHRLGVESSSRARRRRLIAGK
jgi:hypothetical protein